jgi:GTP cyclohydrolase II
MLHVDSQNGMGSGYTKNEFVFDLSERAGIRHRGEYTSEQTYKTTMFGGFTTIGINGDPRSENNNIGYQITPVILDFLGANKKVIMLTNNPLKMKQMKEYGYEIIRVKSIGAVNVAGSTEATQRGTEFHHLDINGDLTSFKEDYERIKEEISEIALKKVS